MRKLGLLLLFVIFYANMAFVSTAEEAASPTDTAANNDHESKYVKMLKDISILDDTYTTTDSMTRLEFVKIIANIYGNDHYDYSNYTYFSDVSASSDGASQINKLASYGLLKGGKDSKFHPNDPITIEQASIILLRMIGYDSALQNNATNYLSLASEKGILKGVDNSALNSDSFVEMIYNALTIDVLQQVSYGDKVKFSITANMNLLNSVMDIYQYSGIMYAVGKYALDSSYEISDNMVRVGDMNFVTQNSSDYTEYVGFSVTAYYKQDVNNDYALICCVKSSSNEELTIDLDNIESISRGKIVYKDANGISHKVNISTTPYIIYNNRCTGVIPTLGDNGTLKLISNGGAYDTIIIKSYSDYVVDNISQSESTIGCKYGAPYIGSLRDATTYCIKTADGKNLSLNSLTEWNVLSVATSADGDYTEIIVSTDKVTGSVDEVLGDSNNYQNYLVTIDGKEYNLTEEYYNYIMSTKDNILPGDTGTFYLDMNGRIAGFDRGASQDMHVGYLINMGKSNDVGQTLQAKILTDKGVVSLFNVKQIRNQIMVNNAMVGTSQFLSSNKPGGIFTRQVIRYLLDSTGEITKIETAASSTRNGLYLMFDSGTTGYTYRKTQKTFGDMVLLSDNPIVFVVPAATMAFRDDLYCVKQLSYFKSGSDYHNIQCYGYINGKMTSDIIVNTSDATADLGYGEGVGIIQNMTKSIDKDGNVVDKLYLLKEGKQVALTGAVGVDLSRTSYDPTNGYNPTLLPSGTPHPIEIGDIVRCAYDMQGNVDHLQLLYDCSQNEYLPSANYSSQNSGQYKVGSGYILQKEDNAIALQYTGNDGTAISVNYFFIPDKLQIEVYDDSISDMDKKVRLGSINDIRTIQDYPNNPSRVFIHEQYGNIMSLIIYNKKI